MIERALVACLPAFLNQRLGLKQSRKRTYKEQASVVQGLFSLISGIDLGSIGNSYVTMRQRYKTQKCQLTDPGERSSSVAPHPSLGMMPEDSSCLLQIHQVLNEQKIRFNLRR